MWLGFQLDQQTVNRDGGGKIMNWDSFMVARFAGKYYEWHDMIIVGSEWLLVGYAFND